MKKTTTDEELTLGTIWLFKLNGENPAANIMHPWTRKRYNIIKAFSMFYGRIKVIEVEKFTTARLKSNLCLCLILHRYQRRVMIG